MRTVKLKDKRSWSDYLMRDSEMMELPALIDLAERAYGFRF